MGCDLYLLEIEDAEFSDIVLVCEDGNGDLNMNVFGKTGFDFCKCWNVSKQEVVREAW